MIYETWGQFGVVFGGKEGPVTPGERTSEQSGVHFGVTLGSLWAYRRRMACMMCIVAGLMGSLSDPNGPINRKYTFSQGFLILLQITGAHKNRHKESSRRDFGVILSIFWGRLATLG